MSADSSSLDRRSFLASSAAAGAIGVLSGPIVAASEPSAIRPFRVHVPEAELADLRRRVRATKWSEREQVADATQGVQLATMQKLAQYWAKCTIGASAKPRSTPCRTSSPRSTGSTSISFTYVRSIYENALPMSSSPMAGPARLSIEQMKIIDPLTDPTAHGGTPAECLPSRDSVPAGLRLFR